MSVEDFLVPIEKGGPITIEPDNEAEAALPYPSSRSHPLRSMPFPACPASPITCGPFQCGARLAHAILPIRYGARLCTPILDAPMQAFPAPPHLSIRTVPSRAHQRLYPRVAVDGWLECPATHRFP